MLRRIFAVLLSVQIAGAWGVRGHTVANLAAVETLPDSVSFLRTHKAYIGHLGPIPDTWRNPNDPFLRISEDPNHGWYTESFDFIKEIPRSRTELILRVYDEYLQHKDNKLLNIRYTGLQAYSMMEGYERLKAGMRYYRRAGDEQTKSFYANDIAFYMGWLGHYVADAAMPLHNSRHHDGWDGENPKGYTRDPHIHDRFESSFVELIAASEGDVLPFVRKDARHLDDPWTAILDHMMEARGAVEDVYRLDLRGAFEDKDDAEARKLVLSRLGSGAAFLRDLVYTAWIESEKAAPLPKPEEMPENPLNPRYNPATGSAAAPVKK